ncbi:hypothetical protein [Nonomuraea sp. KM90]|uniref:hypothetical protein n=1 Tax=Nonomuraea sp. KM90 TaxID=3457428 RepID=UPI003FCED702
MADWAKLIEAIAGLLGAVAWPVAIVLATRIVIRRHRLAFERLIDRVQSISYPGGQVDLGQIAIEQEHHVGALVQEASAEDLEPEQREALVRRLAREAERLGGLRLMSEADLTAHERVVLDLRTQGLSRDAIAQRLNVTKGEVSRLLDRSRIKLGFTDELAYLHYLRRRTEAPED